MISPAVSDSDTEQEDSHVYSRTRDQAVSRLSTESSRNYLHILPYSCRFLDTTIDLLAPFNIINFGFGVNAVKGAGAVLH